MATRQDILNTVRSGVPAAPPAQPARLPQLPQPARFSTPLPYMAIGRTDAGEPYYGDGLRGWARRIYGNLADPSRYTVNAPTERQQRRVDWLREFRAEHDVLYNAAKGFLMGPLLGIGALTGEDWEQRQENLDQMMEAFVADPSSLLDFQKRQAWNIGIGSLRGEGQGALFSALQLGEIPFRKAFSRSMANAEIAQQYAEGAEIPLAGLYRDPHFWTTVPLNPVSVAITAAGKARDPNQGVEQAIRYLVFSLTGSGMFSAEALRALGQDDLVLRMYEFGGLTPEEARIMDRNMRASQMVYTAWVDEAAWMEAQRRIEAGECAERVVMEMQNPWAEFAGSMVFDLYNIFDLLGAAMKAPRILNAADDFLRPVDEAVTALRRAANASDDIAASQHVVSAFDGLRSTLTNRLARSGRVDISDFRLLANTQEAKQYIALKRTGIALGNIMRTSADEAPETAYHMVRMFSNNADEANHSIAILMRNPAANMIFSNAGLDSAVLLRRIADDVGGLNGFRRILDQSRSADELIEALGPRLERIVKSMYPTVSEMRNAEKAVSAGRATARQETLARMWTQMSNSQRRWLSYWNSVNTPTSKLYRAINTFFGYVYMGFNPGYALRNLLSDSTTIFAEYGAKAGLENVVGGLGDVFGRGTVFRHYAGELGRILGVGSPEKAFPNLLSSFAPHSSEIGKPAGRLFIGFRGAEAFERHSSAHIALMAVRREMRRALRSGLLPDIGRMKQMFVNIGMSEADAVMYRNILFRNWGDVRKANREFLNIVATGRDFARRYITPPRQVLAALDGIPNYRLSDRLEEAAHADSLTEADEIIDEVRRTYDQIAQAAETEIRKVQAMSPEVAARYGEAENALLREADEMLGQSPRDSLWRARAMALDGLENSLKKAENFALDTLRHRGVSVEDALMKLRQQSEEYERWMRRIDDARDALVSMYVRVRDSADDIPASELRRMLREAEFPVPFSNRIERIADIPDALDKRTFTRVLMDFFDARRTEAHHILAAQDATRRFRILRDAVPQEMLPEIAASKTWRDALRSSMELEAYFSANSFDDILENYRKSVLAAARFPQGATLDDIARESLEYYGWNSDKVGLFNAVNADRAAAGLPPASHFSDIPIEEAVESMARRVGMLAPNSGDVMPTQATLMRSIQGRIFEQIEDYRRALHENWNVERAVSSNPRLEPLLEEFARQIEPRLAQARSRAFVIAQLERDWILHDYQDKKYFDLVLSRIYPYHFWYTRSYPKWIVRLAENPAILARYLKYRRMMEVLHAGMPDWWKQNLSTNDLPGIEMENPLYFNLEAMLNQLNGLTGVDFNDRNRRTTWYARAVDDLGKFGPSVWTPLQWLTAAALYAEGEEEAAKSWLGRLIPQTATLKGLLYQTNIRTGFGNQYNEFDPFISLFHGGLDPYERRRVGRALGMMVDEGLITPEQAQEAAYSRSGPIWAEAVNRAQDARFAGQMAGFMFGTGFKARSQTDIEIDNFYTDYYALMTMRPNMSPREFRDAMTQLREQYPWMDTVLLSRQSEEDRDMAYAFSVLSRIPPGQMNDIARAAGIDSELINIFYDQKGNFDGWTEQDRQRFMAGIVDIGAILSIPDTATVYEWNAARDNYSTMRSAIEAQLGSGIWEQVDYYYSLDREQRRAYAERHPEIQRAFDLQNEYIMRDPLLFRYYGGIDTLERYWNGWVYDQLDREFGSGIRNTWDEYYELRLQDARAANRFYRAHPELRAYSRRRRELQDQATRQIAHFASMLPEQPQVPARSDVIPQGPTQERLYESLQPAPQMTWADWQAVLSPAMQQLIIAWWYGGQELSSAAMSELRYTASRMGISEDDALQMIANSLARGR